MKFSQSFLPIWTGMLLNSLYAIRCMNSSSKSCCHLSRQFSRIVKDFWPPSNNLRPVKGCTSADLAKHLSGFLPEKSCLYLHPILPKPSQNGTVKGHPMEPGLISVCKFSALSKGLPPTSRQMSFNRLSSAPPSILPGKFYRSRGYSWMSKPSSDSAKNLGTGP